MDVAVAVISDEKNRILLTRRPKNKPHGGMWEFPGGKLEKGESSDAALLREVKEEVGLEVVEYNYLGTIHHEYSNRVVNLLVFHVTRFSGEPQCCESQMDLIWVEHHLLPEFDFPEANFQILNMINSQLAVHKL